MIPKIIHYCWFGGNPLPESAKKCIASWKKYLPNYEIKEWNEDNFDVNIIPYTQQAYEAKKYAFVSDYARFWILYKYGGLYFDTDVEIIKPLDDIISQGPFMGIEVRAKEGEYPQVAPGLGLGATPGHELYKILLDKYTTLRFLNEDGSLNQKTIVKYNTEVLQEQGLLPSNEIQIVSGVWIYPADYFNPLDSLTGKLKLTDNTRSIHWYMNSWSDSSAFRQWLSRMSHRLFGTRIHNIKNALTGLNNYDTCCVISTYLLIGCYFNDIFLDVIVWSLG